MVLAGGTGGAKLARGMLDVVGGDDLVVIANTADDIEIYGAYVSPDPDLVTFWLADLIDERGWGLAEDTFHTMQGLRDLGAEVWFNLGDRDLAVGIERARMLAAGVRLTEAQQRLARALGLHARVLPMADAPVRTRILAHDETWGLQEFLIKARGRGPVEDVAFRGADAATPTAEVLDAIGNARAIVIGPSNPVISIGPILAVPGIRSSAPERHCAGRRGQPTRAGGGGEGTNGAVPAVARPAALERRNRRDLRRADRGADRRRAD